MSRDASNSPPTYGFMGKTTTGLPDPCDPSSNSVSEGIELSTCNPPSSKNEDDGPTSTNIVTHEIAADGTLALDLRHVFPWAQLYQYKTSEAWLSNSISCRSQEYHFAQPPYELEGCGTQLPYVHSNSMTGLSNESEDTVINLHYDELPVHADSVVGLPVVQFDDDNLGITELVVDHDMIGPVDLDVAAGVPLQASTLITPPATPPSQSIRDIASRMQIDCVVETEHRQSDAHFYSEQSLFSQSPVRPVGSTGMPWNEQRCGSIDIADFLKLGHAKQCWCDHCNDKSRDSIPDQKDVQWACSPTLTDQTCVDNDLSLSLILNPSESNFVSDSESEAPELLDLFDPDANNAESESGKIEAVEDEDWLVFSRSTPASCRLSISPSPLYLPSSPILHRQRQQRSSTPTIIITTSADTSLDDRSDEYVAVPPSTASVGTQTPVWYNMFPRRPSSAWTTGLAELSASQCLPGPPMWSREAGDGVVRVKKSGGTGRLKRSGE
jgi:hypothetical protein